jgi:hypothetical protein
MRSLLVTALALATQIPATTEACGDYFYPRVFLLSNHYAHEGERSFAVMSREVPARLAWTALAPMTYDNSKLAPAPALEPAQTLTLVGPDGRSIVTSRARWYLDSSWRPSGKATVLEVEATHEFAIALAGAHEDAAWIAVDPRTNTQRDLDWVAAQGVHATNVSVSRIHGTTLDAVTAYRDDATAVTFVRSGTANVGSAEGHALGGLTVRGRRYLLTEQLGMIERVAI